MKNKLQFRIFTILDLDKEEEYLHEMHLKGWRYRTSRFGFFYFEQGQPDDVMYRVWNTSYLRKNEIVLQSIKDRGWEFVERCPYFVFRKATGDIVLNDQSFIDNRLRWEGVKSGFRSCVTSISGGLVVCMSLFREDLSMSFFVVFLLYAFLISYLILGYFRLKRVYRVDKQ